MSEPDRHEVVVESQLQRHQLRQFLNVSRIRYDESLGDRPGQTIVHISATPEQWVKIDEWVERIKVKA